MSDPKPRKRSAADLQANPSITDRNGYLVVRDDRLHHYIDDGEYLFVEDLAGDLCLVQHKSKAGS